MGYSPTLGRWLEQDPISDLHAPAALDKTTAAAGWAAAISTGRTLGATQWLVTHLWEYADGLNLYQFVRSNPATRRDPSGLGTIPGTNIPDNLFNPWRMAEAVEAHLRNNNYDRCPNGRKEGFRPGDINHCVFGCLFSIASQGWYDSLAGFTEIVDFDLQDLKMDYVGTSYGAESRSAADCASKCQAHVCKPAAVSACPTNQTSANA